MGKIQGTCSVEASRYKTVSRNVVLVESVSTSYNMISGAISGVQIQKSMDNLLFVLEDSCSLYAYSMSRHLNQSYSKNCVDKNCSPSKA